VYKAFDAGCLGIQTDLRETVRLAQANGFEGLAVNMAKLEELGPEGYRKATQGLRPASWTLPVPYAKEEAAFRDGLEVLERQAKLASAIGADRCVIWIPPWSETRPFEKQFEFLSGRLRECATLLKEHGCRLGLEFIGPRTSRAGKPHEFIHTLPAMLGLCDAIGTGNVGLLLDSWHWYTSAGTVDEILSVGSPARIVHAHVNDAPAGVSRDEQIDNIRELPGATGVIDLAGFLGALQGLGYEGPVQVEPFCARLKEMSPDEAARATAESLKPVWSQLGLQQAGSGPLKN
jgi:sugar phosphate isomerase/epimerase